MDVFFVWTWHILFLVAEEKSTQRPGGKFQISPRLLRQKILQIARSTFGRSTTRTGGFQVVTSVGTFRDDSDGRFFGC